MPSISQFTSIAHSCPPHCDPKYWSTPGSPVHHQFPELTLTHVHRVGDAIQPSHPLSSPSLSTFNLSHHQFRISPANEYSGLIFFDGEVGYPCSQRDSQESSPTPQFKSISTQLSLYSNSYIHTWLLEKL